MDSKTVFAFYADFLILDKIQSIVSRRVTDLMGYHQGVTVVRNDITDITDGHILFRISDNIFYHYYTILMSRITITMPWSAYLQ